MEGYCFIDRPRSGWMNMAVDQFLARLAGQQQVAVLRLYQWSEPTLSLGYFQAISDRGEHSPSLSLPLVRRATGGGAIVHHHDWTYSLAVPDRTDRIGPSTDLYELVHDALVSLLCERGFAAQKWSGCITESQNNNAIGERACKKFLCFERRSTSDIVAGDHKILGSAQRRTSGALLQHGSLLVRTSNFAPSLIGLYEIHRSGFPVPSTASSTNGALPAGQLNASQTADWERELGQKMAQRIVEALSHQCNITLARGLPQSIASELEMASGDQFASEAWNAKR